jgi:hypothetical protein
MPELTERKLDRLRQMQARMNARGRLYAQIRAGQIPAAKTLSCVECAGPATEYDHYAGYDGDAAFLVDPVCHACHLVRTKLRGALARSKKPEVTLDPQPAAQFAPVPIFAARVPRALRPERQQSRPGRSLSPQVLRLLAARNAWDNLYRAGLEEERAKAKPPFLLTSSGNGQRYEIDWEHISGPELIQIASDYWAFPEVPSEGLREADLAGFPPVRRRICVDPTLSQAKRNAIARGLADYFGQCGERLYSPNEVAARLRVDRDQIGEWFQGGELTLLDVWKSGLRISASELRRFRATPRLRGGAVKCGPLVTG